MKNEMGASLIPLTIASAAVISFSVMTVQTTNDSNKVIDKAEEAKVQFAHGEVNEQLELDHQVYYIDKFTGDYNGSLMDFLKDKGYAAEDGVVNMSSLLGKRENRIETGKGSDDKDVYKVELDNECEDETIKVLYYDGNGNSEQIGELYGNIE